MDKYHVLIIDDDRNVAGYFQLVLNIMGFQVETAFSVKEALACLATSVPNLILLDLRLGHELGGEDILFQIRSNPRFDNTRVIIITGYPNTTDVVANLADLILIKPVEFEQLKQMVTRMASFELEPRNLPFRDPVTQLFNKDFFYTRLELAFERAKRRPDFLFAVLVLEIQLSGFNIDQIAADESVAILAEVARRLKRHLRPTDTLARLYGWKFATLHEDLTKREDYQVILRRLESLLTEPYRCGDKEFQMLVNFGVAVNGQNYREPKEIFDDAERSLTRAEIR